MSRFHLYYLFLITMLSACVSSHTAEGWEDHDLKSGGFQKVPFFDQETPPGCVLVEGMESKSGKAGADSLSIRSFYISKTEETNRQYLAYLEFLRTYYSKATYTAALPDSSLWITAGSYHFDAEGMMQNYLRDPAYRDYPVVGLTPEQIKGYAQWKTDRLNEYVLVREGVIPLKTWAEDSSQVFTTESYLMGTYSIKSPTICFQIPNQQDRSKQFVRLEDDILFPRFRLLTYDEWSWAYLAVSDSNGHYVSTSPSEYRHRYDKSGAFDHLMDNTERPGSDFHKGFIEPTEPNPVYCFPPNAYGIYALNGNVSELVRDSTSYCIAGCDSLLPSDLPLNRVPPPMTLDSNSSYLYGFRLGMDRIIPMGILPENAKRGKAAKASCRSCIAKRSRQVAGHYTSGLSMIKVIDLENDLILKRNGSYSLEQKMNGTSYNVFGNWRLLGDYVLLYPDPSASGPLAVVYRLPINYEGIVLHLGSFRKR